MILRLQLLMTEYDIVKMLLSIMGWAMAFLIEFTRPHLPAAQFYNDQDMCERSADCSTMDANTIYIPHYKPSSGTTPTTYLTTSSLMWRVSLPGLGEAKEQVWEAVLHQGKVVLRSLADGIKDPAAGLR